MSPSDRLDGLLAVSARRAPDEVALVDGELVTTYGELEVEVQALSAQLLQAGVRPAHRVGVHLPKGYEAVLVIYAVLRTGAVVAPLDHADPSERTTRSVYSAGLDFLVVSRSGPSVVESDQLSRRFAESGPSPPLPLGANLELLATSATVPQRQPSDDAYILFTSGSTGWPKGVLHTHSSVLHFVRWAVTALGVRPTDRIGSQSALTFDLSTFDLFGAAMVGACVTLLPEPLKPFPRDVVSWLGSEHVSVFYAVPTLYRAMAERGGITSGSVPDLRTVAFAGEPFPLDVLDWYLGELSQPRFYNLYGPTETNVCTFTEVTRGWTASDGLSVGKAIDGLWVELVDDGRAGAVEGEIAVAGPALFRGYLRGGKLTDPAVSVRFTDGVSRRAYLTGDLGRRDGEGRIWLRGRRDHQVKVRGHRIDLGDVESLAAELPAVRDCVAVVTENTEGSPRLRLWTVAEGVTGDELRDLLVPVMPRRMLPDEVRVVDELPLNIRGKIDRPALAERT